MKKYLLLLSGLFLVVACDQEEFVQIDRNVKPGLSELRPHNLPRIKKFELENGLQVYVVENEEVPLVSVSMVFKAGSVNEPPELAGLTDVTVKMLGQGTEKHDSKSFIEKLESTGAYFKTNTDFESAAINMTTLKSNIEPAIQLFADAMLHPAFSETELKKLVSRKINDAKTKEADSHYLVRDKFNEIIYGSHPYGRSSMGSGSLLSRISSDKVRRFYAKYFTAKNGSLIFSGNISPKEAKYFARTYFESMKSGVENVFDYTTPPAKNLLKIYFIEDNDASYATIRIGSLGLSFKDPQLYSAIAMNKILGGYENSRINKRLSETTNWQHKAYTTLNPRIKSGPFFFSGYFKTDKADSAIQIVLEEFEKMVKNPPTNEELTLAKSYLTGKFYLETETADQVAKKIQDIIVYDLDLDYLKTFSQKIDALQINDINEVSRKIIDVNRLSIVVAGNSKILKRIKKIAPTLSYNKDMRRK